MVITLLVGPGTSVADTMLRARSMASSCSLDVNSCFSALSAGKSGVLAAGSDDKSGLEGDGDG